MSSRGVAAGARANAAAAADDGWDIARDIAIIILVIQGCLVFLALFVRGLVGSIAIIETTVKIRRGLRLTARSTERVHDTVNTAANQRVLASVIRIERVRAAVDSYATSLQEELRRARMAPTRHPGFFDPASRMRTATHDLRHPHRHGRASAVTLSTRLPLPGIPATATTRRPSAAQRPGDADADA